MEEQRVWEDFTTARVERAVVLARWKAKSQADKPPSLLDFLTIGRDRVPHEQTPEEMLAVAEAWVAAYGGKIVD